MDIRAIRLLGAVGGGDGSERGTGPLGLRGGEGV